VLCLVMAVLYLLSRADKEAGSAVSKCWISLRKGTVSRSDLEAPLHLVREKVRALHLRELSFVQSLCKPSTSHESSRKWKQPQNAYPVPKTFSCHSNVLVSVCHEAPSPALCSRILGLGLFNPSPAGGVKCKLAKDDRVVSVVGGVTGRLWMIGARASLGALTRVMLTRICRFWMGSGDR
jgi:hypothetical protein